MNIVLDNDYIPSKIKLSNKLKTNFEAARVARLAAIQALFQKDQAKLTASQVIDEFKEYRFTAHEYPYQPNIELFTEIVLQVEAREVELITLIEQNLLKTRNYATLEPVLQAILKAGALELVAPIVSIPLPVVIIEYITITQGFFNVSHSKLANAVLDRIARNSNRGNS